MRHPLEHGEREMGAGEARVETGGVESTPFIGVEANGPRDLSGLFLFLSWLDEPFFFLRVEPSLWPTGLARPVLVSSSTPDQEQSNRKDIFPNDFKPNRS
jgi:hypothetical protein